jgi:hypothetical protein
MKNYTAQQITKHFDSVCEIDRKNMTAKAKKTVAEQTLAHMEAMRLQIFVKIRRFTSKSESRRRSRCAKHDEDRND